MGGFAPPIKTLKRVPYYSILFVYTLDVGAEAHEFFDEMIVAAVDMMNISYLRFSLGDQSGQNHRRSGAQIRRLDLTAHQRFNAFDHGGEIGRAHV